MAQRTCTFDGCDNDLLARGWCGTHYSRWRKYGEPYLPARTPLRPCRAANCGNKSKSRGYCSGHLQRVLALGHADDTRPLIAKTPVTETQKFCTHCREMVAREHFPSGRGAGGLASRCYECRRLISARFYADSPDYWNGWRAANQDKVRDARERRRAAKLNQFVEDVQRAVVFERDDYVCMICREPLDMNATWPAPLSPTLDHIVPLSRGGDHSYVNAQSAHARCNTAKGDRELP